MNRRAQYEMPAGLKEAQQRFEEWRGSHSGRRPIPEPLWALAAAQASEHGVFRTAQVLRLDYTKLKQYTRGATPGGKPPSTQTAFVELSLLVCPVERGGKDQVEGTGALFRDEPYRS